MLRYAFRRYSKAFTIVIPTLFNVCEYWFNKDQIRLRDIRPDTLGQMLNLASVRPGGRYLAVDDASGIVVAAILQRLGGTSISFCIICFLWWPLEQETGDWSRYATSILLRRILVWLIWTSQRSLCQLCSLWTGLLVTKIIHLVSRNLNISSMVMSLNINRMLR